MVTVILESISMFAEGVGITELHRLSNLPKIHYIGFNWFNETRICNAKEDNKNID